jgi:hypothetical protein
MIDRYYEKNENKIKVGCFEMLALHGGKLMHDNAPSTYTPKFHQGLYEKV